MNIILERVYNVCKSVQDLSPKITNFKKLISLTRKAFAKHEFDLVIRTKKDKNLDWDNWYVVAYYDSDNDRSGEIAIEIIVYHNLTGTEDFGEHQIRLFLTEIFDATVHEYRHQYQSMRRDFVDYVEAVEHPYELYLANQDEMDAYAFSIAIELLRTMDAERAKRRMGKISVLSKMRTGSQFSSPTLRAYIYHFGMCNITKRLAKKIYYHLETVDKRHIFM